MIADEPAAAPTRQKNKAVIEINGVPRADKGRRRRGDFLAASRAFIDCVRIKVSQSDWVETA